MLQAQTKGDKSDDKKKQISDTQYLLNDNYSVVYGEIKT